MVNGEAKTHWFPADQLEFSSVNVDSQPMGDPYLPAVSLSPLPIGALRVTVASSRSPSSPRFRPEDCVARASCPRMILAEYPAFQSNALYSTGVRAA